MPLSPNTITSRAWSMRLADQRHPPRQARIARPRPLDLRPRTHSAPARVLPAPRPPSTSQARQSPAGGSWCGCAQNPNR